MLAAWLLWSPHRQQPPTPTPTPLPWPTDTVPVTDAAARMTKKTFGLYVDPAHSPVQPERFGGWHTGTDFELLPGESPDAVVVRVICDGPLLQRRWVSGYGGLAVQSCTIAGGPVTVIYGHLKLTSIAATAGTALARGQALGTLGAAYSQETDGERAHLHLGIHRGTASDIRGYVQKQAALSGWSDPLLILHLK